MVRNKDSRYFLFFLNEKNPNFLKKIQCVKLAKMIRMGGDDLFGRWSDQILKIDQEVIIVAPVSPVIMIDELIFEIFWNFKPESIWPRIHFLLVPTFTLAASLFHFAHLEIAHRSPNNFRQKFVWRFEWVFIFKTTIFILIQNILIYPKNRLDTLRI